MFLSFFLRMLVENRSFFLSYILNVKLAPLKLAEIYVKEWYKITNKNCF